MISKDDVLKALTLEIDSTFINDWRYEALKFTKYIVLNMDDEAFFKVKTDFLGGEL